MSDARRRAEEALRYDHDHANSPEVRRRLRGAVEALLAAGPEAKAPGHDRIAELESLLRECNAVCLCGCPDSEHEADECGESCGNDDHECIRVPKAVLAYVKRLRSAAPPPSDAVREAVSKNDVYTLIGHAEYLRKVRGEEDMPKFFDGLARRLLAALDAGPETVGSARFEAAYQREHARLTEVLGALSEVLPPGAEIRPALLALKARAEASEPASKRGPVADAADARRRAEEYLRFWGHHESEGIEIMRALLAAGPEAKTPGYDRIGELEALLRECNAVCLCGCPDSEHESYGEDGESCGHDDHECIRVAPAVLEIVQRYRVALSDALAQKHAGAEVREAVSENDVYTLIGHAEYLRKVRGEEDMPKFFDGLARRLLSALRANASPAPGSEGVREAAERLWHSLTPPRSTTDDGMLLVRAEDVEAVLRALASSPAAPAKDAVREAAERLVHKIDEVNASTAYIGIWDFAAQHSLRYDGPRLVGELDALRAALSRPAAKGGE